MSNEHSSSLNSLITLLKRLQRPASQSGWGQQKFCCPVLLKISNMARVTAAVREFLNIWECGGSASLQLDTSQGGCTVRFSAHLGHPGALLQPSPPPPACPPSHPTSGQRYRGPSDKQRSRVRAANREAAAKAAAPPETPVPTSSTSADLNQIWFQ